MIYILIHVDRKTAISLGNFQCGDVLVEVNPSEFSVEQQEELYKLRSRRLDPNSSDDTKYYDLTGRFNEPLVECKTQNVILKDRDIENIRKECPFPMVGTADKESILSLLDSSIIRREYISSYLDEH